MKKKIWFSMLTVVFLFSTIGIVLAEEKGNSRKGKYIYRNVYKACHERGGVDSAKPAISPDSKSQAQWKRMFDKKDFEDFGCNEEWSKLTDEELLDIFTYLYDHAADSPSPAKCK